MHYCKPHWMDKYSYGRDNPEFVEDLRRRCFDLLSSNKTSGVVKWLVRKTWWLGESLYAGHVHASGYRLIMVDGKHYRASHLAWLMCKGELPRRVWHRNGKRDDNRIANLST